MNFCVLVKISKHKISFWNQSGTSPFEPLVIKDSNEIPLCFYVNGTDFSFGDELAIDRFNSNDPNSFGNYFEIIKDPSNHFTIAGNKKPVKQLLYHGIEKYLNFFITQVLYKNDSLESYRQNFPLRFWFEQDIEEKEKSLIESLFNEAGYDNVEKINYNLCLFEVLSSNKVINNNSSILILNGINNNLFMELYKCSTDYTNSFFKLEGYGADPSVKILAEMILEDILAQESYLTVDKEKEVNLLLTYSAERLENITPIIKGEAILSDGKKHYFEAKQRVLNDRLLYYSNDSIMYAAINDLLSGNNILIENLVILLGSKEINTTYLINKLLVKYPNVLGLENKYKSAAIKLIFAKISKTGYLLTNTTKNLEQKINTSSSPTSNLRVPPLPPRVQLPSINTPPIPPRNTVPISAPTPLPSSIITPQITPNRSVPPVIPIGSTSSVPPQKKTISTVLPPGVKPKVSPPKEVNSTSLPPGVKPNIEPPKPKLPPPPPPPPPKIKNK